MQSVLLKINCLLLLAVSVNAFSLCGGRIVNPITDVCWKCIFPINIAGIEINIGEFRNYDVPVPPICVCPVPLPPPLNIRVGFGLSFWEIDKFVEVVRTPFCSPTLGGAVLVPGVPLPAGTNSKSNDSNTGDAFFHVHVMSAPIMDWVGTAIGSGLCLSIDGALNSSQQIEFMSELDPMWNDDSTTLLLNPEALLFNNPVTIAACVPDAVSATVAGFGLDPLFWCSGSQGTIYPLNGNNTNHYGGLDSALVEMHKAIFLQHRLGMGWDTSSPLAFCGAVLQPMLRKTQYKYNVMFPVPQPQMGHGFGGQTYWGAGEEIPFHGEDYNFLLFRKRACCAL